MCDQLSSCNGNGVCFLGTCSCDFGWFGDFCDSNFYTNFKNYFILWQCITGFLFAILVYLSVSNMNTNIQESRRGNYLEGCNYYLAVIKSPINITMLMIFFSSCSKILWILIDPFRIYHTIPRYLERVFAESSYSFLFCNYMIILFIWYTIYDEISYQTSKDIKNKRKCICRYYKMSLKFRIFLVFLGQLITSLLKGLRDEGMVFYSISAYVMLYILFTLFIVEFLIFGNLLHKSLRNMDIEKEGSPETRDTEENKTQPKKEIKKDITSKKVRNIMDQRHSVVRSTTISPDIKSFKRNRSIILSKSSEKKSNDIFTFDRVGKSKVFDFNLSVDNSIPKDSPVRKTALKRRNFSSSDKSDEFVITRFKDNMAMNQAILDVEEVMNIDTKDSFILENAESLKTWEIDLKERKKINDEYNKKLKALSKVSTEDQLEEEIEMANFKLFGGIAKQKIAKDSDNDKQLENTMRRENISFDKKIIKKILCFTCLGVSVEMTFFLLTVIIIFTNVIYEPIGAFNLLCFSTGLEFLSTFLIYKLFTRVKAREIENLRWISTIGSNKTIVNKKYIFKMPDYLTKGDVFKKELQSKINYLTKHDPEEEI